MKQCRFHRFEQCIGVCSIDMIRDAFLAASHQAIDLIDSPRIAEAWQEPSALEGFTIGGLASHMGRAISTPAFYLDHPEPPISATSVGPGAYFAGVDPNDERIHASIVRRGMDASQAGPTSVLNSLRAQLAVVEPRLRSEGADRRVMVFGDQVMLLDDYLITRIVEMVIHGQDLIASLPELSVVWDEFAHDLALATVVETATIRHGIDTVITAFARKERLNDWPTSL